MSNLNPNARSRRWLAPIYIALAAAVAQGWTERLHGTEVGSAPQAAVDLRASNAGGGAAGETGRRGGQAATFTASVSAYCKGRCCCGPKARGITASGLRAAQGMVAAASVFRFGTSLLIGGKVYTVQDRGGAIVGNRIDLYEPRGHRAALAFGRRTMKVRVLP